MRPAPQALSQDVLRTLYAQPHEHTVDDVHQRIAGALAQAELAAHRAGWAARFMAAQRAGFIPAGRIAAHAGTGLPATWVNCFVQPIDVAAGADSDAPALQAALAETVHTLRCGGCVGLDFSPLRPAAAGEASLAAPGPVAALGRFDAACSAMESPGARPAALMGVLRCDHPDVEAFAQAKWPGQAAPASLSHFNLSIGVTDAFMHALQAGADIALVHAAEPGAALQASGATRQADGRWVYGRVPARRVWRALAQAAHGSGDPGLLFLDRINADNNLAWCETLAATNPCGEQPLPPYGACCLGSFDLTRFVEAPFQAHARLNLRHLEDGERSGRVPGAGLRVALPAGLASGIEGDHRLQGQPGTCGDAARGAAAGAGLPARPMTRRSLPLRGSVRGC